MKILYVTTVSSTMNGFMIPHIKMLVDQGNRVDVAFNATTPVSKKIIDMGCNIYQVEFERSPLNRNNYLAYKSIKEIIQNGEYDIVHTHTPVASAIVRLACRNIENIKVIYTTHGFHFHKGVSLKNWILYYPIEKILSRYTDLLITINKEDYNLAKTKFKAKKVEYLPGVGLDIYKFKDTNINKEEKRKELGLSIDSFLVLSVGELNLNKNHEVIIRAIKNINNPNIHYVICGSGALEGYLKELSLELEISEQIHLLGYRKDINEVYKACDIFVFPSLREGLGMAALEAMACGLPIITSNVHGIMDYSENGVTGYTCDPRDIEEFSEAIKRLYNSKELRGKYSKNNKSLVNKYDMKKSLEQLELIYKNNIF